MLTFDSFNQHFHYQTINEQLKSYNVPLEIVDGYIGSINITIPWTRLLTGNTYVEIKNLEVTVQPRQPPDTPMAGTQENEELIAGK